MGHMSLGSSLKGSGYRPGFMVYKGWTFDNFAVPPFCSRPVCLIFVVRKESGFLGSKPSTPYIAKVLVRWDPPKRALKSRFFGFQGLWGSPNMGPTWHVSQAHAHAAW